MHGCYAISSLTCIVHVRIYNAWANKSKCTSQLLPVWSPSELSNKTNSLTLFYVQWRNPLRKAPGCWLLKVIWSCQWSFFTILCCWSEWLKFWDNALDHSVDGTCASLVNFRNSNAIQETMPKHMDSCDYVPPEVISYTDLNTLNISIIYIKLKLKIWPFLVYLS